MKKILSILAVSVLMFSCSGFGGEKIESEDTKSLILQVMLLCQRAMEDQLQNAMYEKDYVFANNTATMNVKFSTSCGLKTTERTAYEVSLDKWSMDAPLALTTGDLEKGTETDCKITVSGRLKGSDEVSTWASSAGSAVMRRWIFENDDTDGLALTVYNNDTQKNVYNGSVFIATEVTASQGNIGGNFNYQARINGAVYDAPVKIWKDSYASIP